MSEGLQAHKFRLANKQNYLVVQRQVLHGRHDSLSRFCRNAHDFEASELNLLSQLVDCHVAGSGNQNL